jgi:hypothetical protein
MAAQDIPMRCPICEQAVLKARCGDPAAIWIRCITDGDFTIAADALVMISMLPLATRHRVLNVAIIDREPRNLPFVDGPTVSKGRMEGESKPVRWDGR